VSAVLIASPSLRDFLGLLGERIRSILGLE
jgi:hypothetical protein